MLDDLPGLARDVSETTIAVTAIGGAALWVMRKLRRLYNKVNDIYRFLVGDEDTESLVDRIVKEEFRSRFMMMHARDGVYECDSAGHCTYVNPTLAKMFGLEASEMMGQGWLAAVLPSERQRVWDAWEKAAKNGTPYEASYTLKSGRKVKSIAHVCFSGDNQKPLYYIGVVWDAQQKNQEPLFRGGA